MEKEAKKSKVKPLSASTIKSKVSSLKHFFSFLASYGIIIEIPFQTEEQFPQQNSRELAEFKTWIQNHGEEYSEHTIRRYKTVTKSFLKWYEEKTGADVTKEPSLVSVMDIRDWHQYLMTNARTKQGKKLAISSVNNSIEAIKHKT